MLLALACVATVVTARPIFPRVMPWMCLVRDGQAVVALRVRACSRRWFNVGQVEGFAIQRQLARLGVDSLAPHAPSSPAPFPLVGAQERCGDDIPSEMKQVTLNKQHLSAVSYEAFDVGMSADLVDNGCVLAGRLCGCAPAAELSFIAHHQGVCMKRARQCSRCIWRGGARACGCLAWRAW